MRAPETPGELGLPAERWWPGQRDTIERVLAAFNEYPFVLLSAPTGSGKTIIATAVQRLLGVDSVNLTHTIGLQDQYIRTMDWAAVVTGRNNHTCPIDPFGGTAERAPCTQGASCDLISAGDDGCSYYRMLYAAAQNPQAVLNYAYAVRIVQAQGIRGYNYNPFHRELLVCDEADLAEQAIIEAVTIQLNRQTIREFDCPTYHTTTAAMLVAWAINATPRIQAWYNVRRTAALCAGHQLTTCKECDHQASKQAAAEYWSATALWRAVQSLCQIGNTADDWIVLHEDRALRIRPIWGWTVARRSLFFAFRRALLMSATLGDPQLLARKLDLPEGQWTYVTMPSYFPAENRPVFYLPVTKVSRNSNEADYDRLAAAIQHVAEQPGLANKKGIIHTGSFRIASELFGRLARTSDRYIAHLIPSRPGQARPVSRQLKERVIYALRYEDRPLIALSPSLATGVDIPYEIGFQVIAKVPFGDLGDPVVRARREYMKAGDPFGKHNYDAEAMNTVVQACGRAVRAPDDKGVTFIIDANFWPLYRRTHTPDHFNVTWTRGGTS